MYFVLIQAFVILILVSGCTSNYKYIDDSSLEANTNTVRIYLEYPYVFLGGANATLLVDTGYGAEYNAVLAISPDQKVAYYVGPFDAPYSSLDLLIDFGEKAIIGEGIYLCGYDAKKVAANNHKVDDNISGDDYICPTSSGDYDVWAIAQDAFLYNPSQHVEKISLPPFATTKMADLFMRTGAGQGHARMKLVNPYLRRMTYNTTPAAVIGALESGTQVEWTRPAGELKLYSILCRIYCGGEYAALVRDSLNWTLLAGHTYFIRLDFYGALELSETPF